MPYGDPATAGQLKGKGKVEQKYCICEKQIKQGDNFDANHSDISANKYDKYFTIKQWFWQ